MAVGVIKDPPLINWKDTSRKIPVDINAIRIPPRTTTNVWTGTGPPVPPFSIEIQKIEGPRRYIIPQDVRNFKPLAASINQFPAEHRDTTPGWIKIIGSKSVINESADVYRHSWMNFKSDTVLYKSPNFINFGLSFVNTTDELGSVFVPTNRVGRLTNGFN